MKKLQLNFTVLKYFIAWVCIMTTFLPQVHPKSSTAIERPDSLSSGHTLPSTLRFKNYNMSSGLPAGFVLAISQDQNGLMWFGDEGEGLVSFDGRNFEVFSHDPEDSTSLSSNRIWCIQADAQNNLWIGTDHGLNRKKVDPANYKDNRFEKFFASSQANDLPDNRITDLFLTSNSDLLIGTAKGLCVYREKRIFERIRLGIYDELEIGAICQARSGNIYVGTNQGLFLLDSSYHLLSHWNRISLDKALDISAITEGPNGLIWISAGELYLFDPSTHTFNSINAYLNPKEPFMANDTYRLLTDRRGRVWIGTISSGAFVCSVKGAGYELRDFQDLLAGGFRGDQIRDIYEDRMGFIWVTAKSKGLNVYDSENEGIDLIVPFDAPPSQSSDNSILAIAEDEKGNVYFGSRSSGLASYNSDKRRFKTFSHHPQDKSAISTNRIHTIKVKSEEEILIGTIEGISLFNPAKGTFTNHHTSAVWFLEVDQKGIIWAGTSDGVFYQESINDAQKPLMAKHLEYPKGEWVTVIYLDSMQRLWIGTRDHGLFRHDIKNNHTEWINNVSSNEGIRFTPTQIRSITEDAKGNIWVGTRESGLYMFRNGENNFEPYPYKMFDGSIRGMTVDDLNNLWLVTHRNIFRLGPATGELSKFGKEYGLYGIHTALKTKEGTLLFGGDHRVLSYGPNDQLGKRSPSKVSVKSITRPAGSGKEGEENNYQFSFRKPLTFEFFIDDYASPEENIYTYQLTNIDKDWSQPGQNQRVSYANLSPGHYTFMVKGADASGTWSENVATIDFTVLAPWWLTVWAKIGYLLAAIALGYTTYQILAFRSKKRRELKKLTYEKEQSELLTQHKLRFFTNISHELRTPLTVMIPSAEKISGSQSLSGEELAKHGNIIKRSANALFSLVDELIQFKRIEEGAHKFAPGKTNIGNLSSRIFDDLDPAAEEKNIDYDLKIEDIEKELWIDQKIFEKVLKNLIFNAIKYTPKSGRVQVKISMEKTVPDSLADLRIDVIDNGIGISEVDKVHIFDRFYRTEQGSGFARGTGIGLDLVKNLVALHHGTIDVESDKGKGSHFTVKLPVQKPVHNLMDTEPDIDPTFGSENGFQDDFHEQTEDHILIVEDDAEILSMLQELFSKNHRLTVAKNGLEGMEKALEYPQPNLIISDVLMPEMNGYELCTVIKKNFKTSHIPVLLLTAKSSISDELEGLGSGANAYVTKPFYPKVLIAKVDNLLKNQKLLKKRFAREAQLNPSEIDIPDPDKELLTRCVRIIEENIQDQDFSVENLAREAGLSRTQLFRKLKYLVGVSASELIYSIRLKRASELLKSGKFTVSEVAYETGFSTPSSFSNTFKKHFKVSPREFIENKGEI
ncbi:two-component regulator propeller domain-containing protein [Echinicola jeungdonensis]|uniref:histidine kinase n=1 Tax=Echinicola jeungdonensis TaxID=709343 RepID=A0ABV5JB75_9BACT|nr:hybrid sensor histidine kinase/response regulator transcription factor [Echinicola jeungdonensis]MDN3670482.1 two-component regulator propeller domain-containing protein [Echinicola jeungdonensis]